MGKYTMSAGKDFSAVPEDKYQVQVLDAETYMGTKFKSTEEELRLKVTFVILDEDKTMLENGIETILRGRRLWARTSTRFSTPKAEKPSTLAKLTAAIYGHEFEEAEVEAFDEKDLIGKQLCVMVDAKPDAQGKIWNNVLSFSRAMKLMKPYESNSSTEVSPKDIPF